MRLIFLHTMFLFRQNSSAVDTDANDNSTLLAVKFKTTERTTYSQPLAEYIASSYAEPPEAYRDDLRVLDELRESATAAIDVNTNVLKRNIRYFGQLSFILSKFPADVNVKFTWYNAFVPNTSIGCQDIYLERAAVLFNIGAIYSQLACKENRFDKDSLTRAFGYFQNAAGVFAHLHGKIVSECRSQLTTDLSAYMLMTLEHLMLAQAQECVWKRSILGHMKDLNVARIAARVAELYSQAIESGSQGSLSNTIPAGWQDHFKVKQLYFEMEAQHRMGMDCMSNNRYGEEVARLKAALELFEQLNELIVSDQRWYKHIRPVIVELIQTQEKLVRDNCQRAEHDNDVIYLEPVPIAAALTIISPYKLAQPKIPEIIENPGQYLGGEELGSPLFNGLVAFVIHQASSVYEDRKDQLVSKELLVQLDGLTADCESVLNSLNLPLALEAIQKPVGLPPNILMGADEIRSEGGYDGIQRMVKNAIEANTRVFSILNDAEASLDREANEDQQVRRGAPPEPARATRKESTELTYTFRSEIARYRDTLSQKRAAENDMKNRIYSWRNFFNVLNKPRHDIEAGVPSTTGNPLTDPHHLQIVKRLQGYLDEVVMMKRDRIKQLEILKRKAAEDDITPALIMESQRMAAQSSTPIMKFELYQFEDLFAERLDMYTSWRAYVEEERDGQMELLDSIREAHDAFITARRNHPLLQERQAALENLEKAVRIYREITNKLHEGIKSYAVLDIELQKLKEQCEDFEYARKLDARELQGVSHESSVPAVPEPTSSQNRSGPPANLVWDPSMPVKYSGPK